MATPTLSDTTILFARYGMGEGPTELTLVLLDRYLRLLVENSLTPGAMGFYAEGARLTVEGSPVIEPLRALEEAGSHLIVCKTCLDHWNLAPSLRVGVIGGMGDIQAAMTIAKKVISP